MPNLPINYALGGAYAKYIQAHFIIESKEQSLAVGDGGQALGLGQQHPSFFAQYYGKSSLFPQSVHDTWDDAWVKTVASFYAINANMELDALVTAYNLGVGAVREGQTNPAYLAKWKAALATLEAPPLSPVTTPSK